ncbi:MAG: fumarate hydratase [Thermoplasmata archaeon]|nr:MAG: fumarate hydratase [Thermoplasmata archaeon]
MISESKISEVVIELLKKAVTVLPKDVVDALQKAYETETDEVPKSQLKTILDNINIANETEKPMCQDTGIPIFFVNVGKVQPGNVEKAIRAGVESATPTVPLRPNAVHPLTRKNPGNNLGEHMPYINYKFSENNYIELSVMPKGAGSENMSAMKMLTPSAGVKGIKQFVLDTLVNAGGKPCPPIIMGVGIGGSADISLKLAKEALLRPIGSKNPVPEVAELEQELYEALNTIGVGPMGLGGKTTLLGINIEYAYCHTASHPVGVNIQCWAARRAAARIYEDETVEFLLH